MQAQGVEWGFLWGRAGTRWVALGELTQGEMLLEVHLGLGVLT